MPEVSHIFAHARRLLLMSLGAMFLAPPSPALILGAQGELRSRVYDNPSFEGVTSTRLMLSTSQGSLSAWTTLERFQTPQGRVSGYGEIASSWAAPKLLLSGALSASSDARFAASRMAMLDTKYRHEFWRLWIGPGYSYYRYDLGEGLRYDYVRLTAVKDLTTSSQFQATIQRVLSEALQTHLRKSGLSGSLAWTGDALTIHGELAGTWSCLGLNSVAEWRCGNSGQDYYREISAMIALPLSSQLRISGRVTRVTEPRGASWIFGVGLSSVYNPQTPVYAPDI